MLLIKFKDILNFLPIIFNINQISNFNISDHHIDNINISNLLKYDLKLSLFRLPRLLTVSPSFERIANLINYQVDLYYYLFEYSFGRMLNNSFIDNPNINRIGFQHGPSGPLKLVCFTSKNDFNQKFINSLNLPNSIFSRK